MKSLTRIFKRRMSRFVEKSILPTPAESIVTFSFDDCPLSAIETGLPMLEAEGWRATIYVACGLCEIDNHLGPHMSLDDVAAVHARGHEIADHTFSHLNIMDVSADAFLANIEKNQKILMGLGLPASRHFAYPYGEVTPALKRALRKRFKTLRGVISPASTAQDANLMNAMRLYSDGTIDDAMTHIETLSQAPQWLHFFTHDVRDAPSEYGCTPKNLQRIIDAVRTSGAQVMTVDQAYSHLRQREPLS